MQLAICQAGQNAGLIINGRHACADAAANHAGSQRKAIVIGSYIHISVGIHRQALHAALHLLHIGLCLVLQHVDLHGRCQCACALSACGSTHACRDVLHLSFAVGLHQRSTCSPAAALSLRNSVTAVRQHADRRT